MQSEGGMPGGLATLKEFVQRAEARRLYREFLRTARLAPAHARSERKRRRARAAAWALARALAADGLVPCQLQPAPLPAGDLKAEIARGFRSAPAGDAYQAKFLLSDGRARLKQLREMLDMQR